MANELYALLGVAPDADAATVRKSYFRGLRAHTAEKDPVRHQELRRAYEILGDEGRRKEYDGSQVGGGEVTRWMEEGNTAYAADDYAAAERAYKRALAISPDYLPARLQLARAIALGGDRPKAFGLLKQVSKDTDNLDVLAELGWIGLAHVVTETQNEPANMLREHKAMLLAVVEAFERHIALAPTSRGGYFGRAKVEYYREDFAAARSWARRSAEADGKADFEDFQSLALVVETHVLQGDAASAAKVIREIQVLTPPQEEVRAFAVEQFVRLGTMMMKAKAFDHALEIFTACREFLPDEQQLRELVDDNLTAANAHSEFRRVEKDNTLLPVTRGLALWAVASYTGEFESDEKGKAFFREVLSALDTFPADQMASQLRRLRERYPHIWKAQDKILGSLLSSADEIASNQRSASSAMTRTGGTDVSSADGCGCLVLFALSGASAALSAGLGTYFLIA